MGSTHMPHGAVDAFLDESYVGQADGGFGPMPVVEILSRPKPQQPEQSKRRRLPRALVKAVMERDAYRCRRCGGHRDLTVDHINPVSNDGTDELENLQTLCKRCNSRKGGRQRLLQRLAADL